MRKIIYNMTSLILCLFSLFLLSNVYWQFQLWNNNTILNTDINQTVNTDLWAWTIWDPIRQWAYQIIKSDDWNYEIWWVLDSHNEITTHKTALNRTFGIITSIINYALYLVSLVALIYLLWHWFIILTASWDDAKYKKWMKWIKYATIALLGIWLSRFIISLIFRIVENIAS